MKLGKNLRYMVPSSLNISCDTSGKASLFLDEKHESLTQVYSLLISRLSVSS